MLAALRKYDKQLVELSTKMGGVLVSPNLQGRIFCHISHELIQRLDHALLKRPDMNAYNNLGGNTLWPAPEGGSYAFNYLPGSEEWLVQPGIGQTNPEVISQSEDMVRIAKSVSLKNRKGLSISLDISRAVRSLDIDADIEGFDVTGIAYESEDRFEPKGQYSPDDVIIAPWSLEQFPSVDRTIAFAQVEAPREALSTDFYEDPGQRIFFAEQLMVYILGGESRQQIGIKARNNPTLIGALDRRRSMLILRSTPVRSGTYFNIADNAQENGPYSDSSCYSIFNGGELGFYELETIAPLCAENGTLSPNSLHSQTFILKGRLKELQRFLLEQKGIDLNQTVYPSNADEFELALKRS